MFGKEKKKLTEEEIYALNAIHFLIWDGEIPFDAMYPIVYDPYYGRLIKARIEEEKETERFCRLTSMRLRIEGYRQDIESTKQKLDETNNRLFLCKAELEVQKNKTDYARDEDHIRNLLWEIWNNEAEVKRLEDELRNKEAQLREVEVACDKEE